MAATVRWAAEHGRGFAAQGQRHSVFGRGQVADGVLVDMRPLRAIRGVRARPGGGVLHDGPGVAAWRRRAGCGTPQAAPYGGSGQVTRSAARCRDGTEVVVYELATMGHAWPGAATDDPMAAPDAPASANDLLWEFFDRHPRRR